MLKRKGTSARLDAGANNLLRALRPEDLALLEPHLEPRRAERGTVLHEAGDIVEFACFLLGGALASYVVVLSSGASVETALIGREGAIGGIVSQGAFARLFAGGGDHRRRTSCGSILRQLRRLRAVR